MLPSSVQNPNRPKTAHPNHPLPPRPPMSPIDLTYTSLHRSASSGHIVFRIWTTSAASPLHLQEGDMDRSGFSAPAAVYERMSPRGYAAVTKGLADSSPVSLGGRLPTSASVGVQGQREEGNGMKRLPLGQGHWANSSGLRKKAVDHILGKVPSAVERSKKEESVWISTTRNLSWAIWEISRRLAFAHAQNEHLALQSATHADEHGAALRLPVPHRQSELQVHLSIIKLDPPARPGAGATPPESPKGSGQGTCFPVHSIRYSSTRSSSGITYWRGIEQG